MTTGYYVPPPTVDPQQRATQVTDANGNITQYAYDTDHLTSKTDALNAPEQRTTSYQYLSTSSSLPTLITEALKTTSIQYYPGTNTAQTKTITDTTGTPVSRIWTYTYNSYGQVLTIDGPRTDVADVMTYAYYPCTTGAQCGQIDTIENALDQVTTYNTYNAHGQPLTITDPNGVVTTLTYDARLRLKTRQVGTETTSYSYYPTGLLQTVTLPDSSSVTYIYDGAHRLTDITDGLGNHTHYSLDSMGNRTMDSTYDPSNVLHRMHMRAINTLNQVFQDLNAAGTAAVTTTYTYDNNGNLASSDAPLARNTGNLYDALNRLTKVTDPASGITKFAYDANDKITSVTDPRALSTTYTNNGFGDVTQLVSPDTGTTMNSYDSGGNLKTTKDARNALATYSYDALNRVSQIAYNDQTINFTYDAGTNGKGRLTGASDANHAMTWTYDTHGRVTGKGQTIGSVTKSVGYAYTNADLTSFVTPSGQTITYGYTNHRITSIKVGSTTLLSGVTYDPFGPPTGWTWGNNTTVTRAYDEDGNPQQIVTAGVTNGYMVDNASRIIGISDSGLSSDAWTLGYDLLDRVTSAATPSLTESWTYDANGNRLTQGGTYQETASIAANSNKMTAVTSLEGNGTPTYDAAGHVVQIFGATINYSNAGQLTSASYSVQTQYVYNVAGDRISKAIAGGGTTLFVYDESHHLIGEYGSSGALIEETVWMGDIPVATLRPSGSSVAIYYIHTDYLNTPRKISLPSTNALAWRWDSDPFGVINPVDNNPEGPNQNPSGLGTFVYNFLFPGMYYDTEIGLAYNYRRHYNGPLGGYVESDPIGLGGGNYSTYGYANENPISLTDPLGLYVKLCSRWLGNTNSSPTSRLNPIRHDYLDVSGQFLGFYSARGANPAWGKGVVNDPGEQDGGRCSPLCNDSKFDAYVLAAAQEIGQPTYCAIASVEFGLSGLAAEAAGARNCQSWARDVIAKAEQNYLAHEHCPTCFK